MSDSTNNGFGLMLRMQAIYHLCMSSASFKREEAVKCDDEHEAVTCRREARVYELAASWLNHALIDYKDKPKKDGGG